MRTLCACFAVAVTAALVALSACGSSSLPDKPQVRVDKTELDWGSLWPDAGGLGQAVFVGSQPTDTVSFQNQGNQDLTVSAANITGKDSALFSASFTTTPVKSGKWGSVQVVFSPVEEGAFSATLEIVSNAENSPTDVPLIPVAQWEFDAWGTVGLPIAGADGGITPVANITVDCMTGCVKVADAGYATECSTTVWETKTDPTGAFHQGSNTLCDALLISDSTGTYQTEYVTFNPGTAATITLTKK